MGTIETPSTPSPEKLLQKIATLEEENRRLKEEKAQLDRLATTDTLTGLMNRRGLERFFKILQPEPSGQSKDERRSESFPRYSIIALDLDNFKIINDLYSHAVGDTVLKEVGSYLEQNVRKTDVVARVGGDEFVILIKSDPDKILEKFSNQDPRTPRAILNIKLHIRPAEASPEKHEGKVEITKPYQRGDTAVSVITLYSKALSPKDIELTTNITFSGGITALSPKDTLETAYERADTAAKVAKAEGRDRFLPYQEGMIAPKIEDVGR